MSSRVNDGDATAVSHAVGGHCRSGSAAVIQLPLRDDPVYCWRGTLEANALAGGNARLRIRTRLTVWNWCGDIEQASQIAALLVENAVRHSGIPRYGRLRICLAVLGTNELTVDVMDPHPHFPGFEEAVMWEPRPGETPRGLYLARCYGAQVTYRSAEDGSGKTVQALIKPTVESA